MNHRKTDITWHDLLALMLFFGFILYQNNDFTKRADKYEERIASLLEQVKDLQKPEERKVILDVTIAKEAELPIGIANNNPCNVKNRGWVGQIGSDKQGHAIFSHYTYGLRAAAITLIKFQKVHKLKTLRSMMKRYSEGGQIEYARYLGKRLGIGIDEEFDVLSVMPEMLKAIVKYETGEQPYPDHDFALAGIYATTE